MLGALGRLLQALEGERVLGKVNPLLLPELFHDPLNDPLVKIVPPEVGITADRFHLDRVRRHLEDREIERAAAEVIDHDLLVFLFIEAVGQGRGRGLVQDAPYLEAGDFARGLGGFALRVVEIGGHGDDRLLDGPPEFLLGIGLQLL